MRALILLILTCAPLSASAFAQALPVPDESGRMLQLAPDDFLLRLQEQHSWELDCEPVKGQLVLTFRARIDSPGTGGSCNMLRIDVDGETVGLKNQRRRTRLLNKPNRFPWSNPPSLTWYLPRGEWRMAYAPDFEVLAALPYYDEESHRFTLDVSDLLSPGQHTLTFSHTGNLEIASHAGCDLTLVFRDLKLEVRSGRGLAPGNPGKPDRNRPFLSGARRSAQFSLDAAPDGALGLASGGQSYALTSRFSTPGADGKIRWRQLRHEQGGGELRTPRWRLRRTLLPEGPRGRLLITDTFTNTSQETVGIRVEHGLELLEGRCERVSFGGREEASLTELNRPSTPFLFLPRESGGIGLVAYDDVLRTHGALYYDDERQVGGLRDDWFGVSAGESYTMTWAVYFTATGNVFDLVNLIRRDWGVSFRIDGGINFFQPHAILAYEDEALRKHLQLMDINIAMCQGGWLDRKLLAQGTKNIGHGPIVAGGIYADYRVRLRQACEKLRRLRPGIKCLIYYDTWIVAGEGIADRYGDSFFISGNGKPRNYQTQSEFGFPFANVVPTLASRLGKEILAKIPTMILDEIGADGLYWDEIGPTYGSAGDYAHPDGHTYRIDEATGQIERPTGAAELASQTFKLALMDAFLERGAMIVGNGPPTTMTEQKRRFTRFTETSRAQHPGLVRKTWLYTPVSYAGYSVYKTPGVTEADFLRDIKEKLWNANLYLYSSHIFYPLFTHENLATYQYPITIQELDEGVIVGEERIITLRSGRFGWPGETWQGELLLFDPDQRVAQRRQVHSDAAGLVEISLLPDEAAVIVVDERHRAG